MANPMTLYNPVSDVFVDRSTGRLTPVGWKYLQDLQVSLTSIDLTSQVTGILPSVHGGTGVNNGTKKITLGGNLTLSGAFALTLTQTGATTVTLPTSGTLLADNTPITANGLTVSTSVAPDGSGLKHARVSTGSIAGGTSAVVTLNWATAFADASYTVVVSVVDTTASVSALSIVHIESQAAAGITVRVNNAAVGALTGTLTAIAFHD